MAQALASYVAQLHHCLCTHWVQKTNPSLMVSDHTYIILRQLCSMIFIWQSENKGLWTNQFRVSPLLHGSDVPLLVVGTLVGPHGENISVSEQLFIIVPATCLTLPLQTAHNMRSVLVAGSVSFSFEVSRLQSLMSPNLVRTQVQKLGYPFQWDAIVLECNFYSQATHLPICPQSVLLSNVSLLLSDLSLVLSLFPFVVLPLIFCC